MSTNHGMDESDVTEIVSNNRAAHYAAVALGLDAINNYGNDDPDKSYDLCKSVGEDIRDEIITPDAATHHRMKADRENTLTETLFARMRGCVDWAEVGRHFITVAVEERDAQAARLDN